jgi:hypothetical protein
LEVSLNLSFENEEETALVVPVMLPRWMDPLEELDLCKDTFFGCDGRCPTKLELCNIFEMYPLVEVDAMFSARM